MVGLVESRAFLLSMSSPVEPVRYLRNSRVANNIGHRHGRKDDSRAGCEREAATTRQRARRDQAETLQPAHGGAVRSLDQAFYLFFRPAASARPRRERG